MRKKGDIVAEGAVNECHAIGPGNLPNGAAIALGLISAEYAVDKLQRVAAGVHSVMVDSAALAASGLVGDKVAGYEGNRVSVGVLNRSAAAGQCDISRKPGVLDDGYRK